VLKEPLYSAQPGKEVDVEEDVFSVVEVQLVCGDHYLTHRVRRRAQHHDYTHISSSVVVVVVVEQEKESLESLAYLPK